MFMFMIVDGIAQLPEDGVFFSTEEDFIAVEAIPPDGNSIVSDGDLLHSTLGLYMRNKDLLNAFDANIDLGLDAVEVIEVDKKTVIFSTELDHPDLMFKSGDLLATNGAIIPNAALCARFNLSTDLDLGLDAVYLRGNHSDILMFLQDIQSISRDDWLLSPQLLAQVLEKCNIDIWFSTEGTAPTPGSPAFLDGDLLSAKKGSIQIPNSDFHPLAIPAGIPSRGVDFGLDAIAGNRIDDQPLIFSTEIRFGSSFTEGDVLEVGNGLIASNGDLLKPFKPMNEFLGADAFSWHSDQPDMGNSSAKQWELFN
jgi:hypothetical protein